MPARFSFGPVIPMPGPVNTPEQFLPVGPSAEGRTLSRPLKDEYDRTLLPAGTLLDDAVISRLEKLGIEGVWVARPENAAGVRTLENVFRDRLDDPVMAAIYEAARDIFSRGDGP